MDHASRPHNGKHLARAEILAIRTINCTDGVSTVPVVNSLHLSRGRRSRDIIRYRALHNLASPPWELRTLNNRRPDECRAQSDGRATGRGAEPPYTTTNAAAARYVEHTHDAHECAQRHRDVVDSPHRHRPKTVQRFINKQKY